MRKFTKFALTGFAALSIFTVASFADDTVLMEMASKTVNVDETFEEYKKSQAGNGLIELVNAQLLEKNYSYEKNKKVKTEVDKKIKEIETNNPDILKEYPDAKDMLDLMDKSGTLLDTQINEYTKDVYTKKYVTTKSLKALYDKKAGEVTSFHIIRLDEASFEGDIEKYSAAKEDIEKQLKSATKDNAVQVFEDLAKKYPGTEQEKNGAQDSVNRDDLSKEALKALDSYKYLGFSKTALSDEKGEFYILKTDKSKRLSFEASKDKLTTYQWDKANEKNSSLKDYLMLQLRKENKIEFTNATDKKLYDAANASILKSYKKAKDGDQ